MKFSIVRSKFLEGLTAVQNIVAAKSTLQILSNALMEVKDDTLCLTTTDLDVSIRCHLPCKVEKPGSTTLPIRRLASIVRELDEGMVDIEVNENDEATLQSGSSYFKIIGLPIRDFPQVLGAEGQFCYKINEGKFREMLCNTSYAISQDETRRVLNCLLLAFKDNKLTMVATDGRRLALVDQEIEFSKEAETEMVLPLKTVNQLEHVLTGNDKEMKIFLQKNQVVFEFGTTVMTSKLFDGVYPNYRQVIPSGCDEHVSVEREPLLAALRRVSVVTTDKSNATRLTFAANELTISIATPEVGEARETLPIKYAGKEISIVFNPAYVMDPLRNMTDDEISIELSDGHSPALIKCSIPFLYVLMPLRIN